ncbi:Branched-chain amino acid ABC transporter substrate-binding protein [Rubrivivax sp. A210]|uniref:branched-chain amino acid ABC transporter substrate-binding protein n=1 Tax=Rubrivivax sp. A210 TaxID=2772301 RepID=UPI00191A2885|nr:branched-chain amino acid ABC transporter substrate-binding protein [Rubrivivax sp. A210]CAD5374809.1 Branched-chain amino acid ABC transporter substrate-binding protein [Rubrivivax sp. A210]
MKTGIRHGAALAAALASGLLVPGLAWAQAGKTVKIAFIDPLSGPFANVGQNQLKGWQFIAEEFNKKNAAGVKFEFVSFDNKGSPQESLNVLKAAIDQGIQYVVQGNGSGAAAAILDAVNKHNERNPGKEVVYINYAAVDPDLTNSKCSYWHFRVDADTSMKMEALTSFMKDQPSVKKVYVIGQNYAHGQQVARYFKETIARKRPDVQVVGDDLHPIGQVKDFAPYVAKIKAAGADSVVTGNWGQDLTLLIKAAKDAGLNADFYTYYAGVSGTPTALAAGVGGKVRVVSYFHNGLPEPVKSLQEKYKKQFNDDWYTGATYNGLMMLSTAMAAAKSTDPVKVAAAMEGLRFKGFQGDVEVRKTDHQLQQALVISEWRKADAKVPYSVENTGWNFQEVKAIPAYVASTPTSCQMKRP